MKLLSPAKINLFLHITGKRPDGYHNLVSLMCCISLYDTVLLAFGVKKTSVFCADHRVPEDETNLAFRAANIFLKALNKNEGVEIFINKKIPVAAGLGGGSSNAAAVLLGLNRYYGHPFSRDELMSMGLSIGADVPFFIFQKPAIATGIGEKLEACEALEPFQILLVYPGFNVSTAEVYKGINLGLTKCKKKNKFTSFKKYRFDVKSHMCNDLEIVTASKHHDIIVIKKTLLNHGARGSLMSGSGSAVFGLFSDYDKVRKAYCVLLQNNKWQVFLADMLV